MTDPVQPARPQPRLGLWPRLWRRGQTRARGVALAVALPVLLLAGFTVVALTGGSDRKAVFSVTNPNATANEFLDAVNTGDQPAAQELLCAVAGLPHGLADYLDGQPRLRLVEPIEEGQLVTSGEVAGTWRGEPVDGRISLRQEDDADLSWCVSVFAVTPPLAPR